MSDASQRAAQQRRIQQLHERLELYNIADSHADPTSTSAGGVGSAGAGGLQAGSEGMAPSTKPSRAAPMLSSPNPTPTSSPASSAFFFASSLLRRTADADVPSFTFGLQRGNGGPAAPSAAGMPEGSRASPTPQPHAQVQMPAPVPAPQLARNLAQEFVGSAASPIGASPTRGASRSSVMTSGAAASPAAPGRPSTGAAYPKSATVAAEAVTTANTDSQRRTSSRFDRYEGSKTDGSEYDEYEVEEVEDYTEGYEDEEDDEEHTKEEVGLTLEDMLYRLHRACSSSSDHAMTSSSLQQAIAAATASSPLARDSSLASAPPTAAVAPRVASTATTTNSMGTTHPFLQQAAEVYRQRHLHKVTQEQQQHHSPFNTGHTWSTDEERSLTDTSTSEITGELDDVSESGSSSGTSSAAAGAPKKAVAAANATAALQNDGLSAAAPVPLAVATAATRSPLDGASAGNALPSSALCFDQLEAAYRRLLVLQEGSKYVSERVGPECFPRPLPRQENAYALAEQRDLVVKRDTEMRAAPPAGATLEDLRQRENAAVEKTLGLLREKFDAAMKSLRPVIDREALIEGKRHMLKQRELDIAKQHEARLVVEREVAAAEQRLMERSEQLRKREEDYNTRLLQHDQEQKAAQEQIGEVEQLSKQVSSWLAILEERDRRLARKEKRLQRVQADLLRRIEDVTVWKRATQRIKQIPPPPSPPRIS
ncbi:hypothetical protein MNV84_05806 [Leishmania braziliensis]|nr:hypothetical protein MNV84_05806 [Leishmania braziliensis]